MGFSPRLTFVSVHSLTEVSQQGIRTKGFAELKYLELPEVCFKPDHIFIVENPYHEFDLSFLYVPLMVNSAPGDQISIWALFGSKSV